MIDSRWEVWDNQALTSVEVSHTNGNLFDLEEDGVTDEMIAAGLWCNIQVGTVFATLTSGVMIMVITSDSATFASGNIPVGGIGCTTYPLPAASLTAKARFSIAVQRYNLHKYLGVVWEPVSEAATGGTLDVWFGLEPMSPIQTQKGPDGYTMT
jgi:hypothetical protein